MLEVIEVRQGAFSRGSTVAEMGLVMPGGAHFLARDTPGHVVARRRGRCAHFPPPAEPGPACTA
jgi:hypothetical protein